MNPARPFATPAGLRVATGALMPARTTRSLWVSGNGLTPTDQHNEPNNGDERAQADLITHRRHHTIA
jgi:hypothetical protein